MRGVVMRGMVWQGMAGFGSPSSFVGDQK